jgi:hypothetical protein
MDFPYIYRKRTGYKVLTAYIFQKIANKGKAEGVKPNATSVARTWYRDQASSLTSQNVNKNRLMNDKQNVVAQITVNDIGKMYMFFYDPKLKDILPYYDTFPLVFPIGFQEGGFLGINLHYLPTYLRAKLMDALYSTANNNKYDDTTKLKLSYNILNGASKFSYFQPCLKKYLWDHVQGKFLYVEPKNWDTALMLPTERFQKANKVKVHNDSVRKVQ